MIKTYRKFMDFNSQECDPENAVYVMEEDYDGDDRLGSRLLVNDERYNEELRKSIAKKKYKD